MNAEELRAADSQQAGGEAAVASAEVQTGEGIPQGSAEQEAPTPNAAPGAGGEAQEPPPFGAGEGAAQEPPDRSSGDQTASAEAYAALALERQLRHIQALDPGVRSWEEVLSVPRADDFTRLVRQGCSPAEAFQVTQFEAIVARRVAAARRAALHEAYGKSHLRASACTMGDDIAVPPDVERQYRAFFPSWSEAQIRADYRRRKP